MSSQYPGSLDTFSTAHQDNVGEKIRAATVNDLADAVNKIEAELGVNPSGSSVDVATRLSGGSQPVPTGYLSPDLSVGMLLPPPRRYRRQRSTPTLVTSFQTGHGFTQFGTGTSNLNDTTDYVLGSQSAWIATNGAGAANQLRKLGGSAVDFTGKNVVVWLKMDDWTHLSQIQLYMGDTSLANYFLASISENFFNNQVNAVQRNGEWQKIVIPWASVSTGAGAPNRAAITDFQFRLVDDNTGNSLKLHVNGIGSVPDASSDWTNGVVSVVFDDGYASQYTEARKKMDTYGFPGTAYVIQDVIGSSGTYMTLAQLQALEAYSGWEVAAHAYTVANHNALFTTLSDADLETELYKIKAWLVANGFRGPDHFAWPGGKFNTSQEAIAARYFSTMRTINDTRYEAVPPSNPRRLMTKSYVAAGTATATITAAIDAAYTNKSWLIIVFHDINNSAQSWPTYSVANFGTVIDYLNTKGIPVRTVGDVMATYA